MTVSPIPPGTPRARGSSFSFDTVKQQQGEERVFIHVQGGIPFHQRYFVFLKGEELWIHPVHYTLRQGGMDREASKSAYVFSYILKEGKVEPHDFLREERG